MHENSRTCSEGRSISVRALFLVVFTYKSSSACAPLLLFNIFFSVNATISIYLFSSYLTRCFFHLCQTWGSRLSFTRHCCKKVIVPLFANHSNAWFITTIALQREISLERAGWHWYPLNPFKMHKGLQGKANCQPTHNQARGKQVRCTFSPWAVAFFHCPFFQVQTSHSQYKALFKSQLHRNSFSWCWNALISKAGPDNYLILCSRA